jgi:Clp amino terminal domain, pathogenicity island component
MMFERFTDNARQVVVRAQSEARQLGHGFIGCEHLLLAVVTLDEPAAAVLREHGLTPERTRAEFIRLMKGPAARPVDLLNASDREALAAIGIDLDVVRSRIEETFGPDALTRAIPGRRSRRRGGLRSRLRRPARAARRRPAVARNGELGNGELLEVPPVQRGHIPFTPRAKKCLQLSLREATAHGDNHIGVQHIALALLDIPDGAVPAILSALGLPGATLRAAILDRYRKAG